MTLNNNHNLPIDVDARVVRILDEELTRAQRRQGDEEVAGLVFDTLVQQLNWSKAHAALICIDVRHRVKEILRQRRQEAAARHRVGSKYLV